jgi:hypothetical protein
VAVEFGATPGPAQLSRLPLRLASRKLSPADSVRGTINLFPQPLRCTSLSAAPDRRVGPVRSPRPPDAAWQTESAPHSRGGASESCCSNSKVGSLIAPLSKTKRSVARQLQNGRSFLRADGLTDRRDWRLAGQLPFVVTHGAHGQPRAAGPQTKMKRRRHPPDAAQAADAGAGRRLHSGRRAG